ncbi:MAG: hypothetical protein AVDCRST_MAG10-2991, partial [uncultured Acidimicrobiales bacterium]
GPRRAHRSQHPSPRQPARPPLPGGGRARRRPSAPDSRPHAGVGRRAGGHRLVRRPLGRPGVRGPARVRASAGHRRPERHPADAEVGPQRTGPAARGGPLPDPGRRGQPWTGVRRGPAGPRPPGHGPGPCAAPGRRLRAGAGALDAGGGARRQARRAEAGRKRRWPVVALGRLPDV